MDAGVALIYLIHARQIKHLLASILAFDIVQFFLLLNYHLLSLILNKARFDFKIAIFFQNYLINKKTKYLWNNFSSSFFNVDVGVGQGTALSPILLALYLSLIFYIFEKRLKNLKIPISFILFIDNSLFISQNKFLNISNSQLFCSYNIIVRVPNNGFGFIFLLFFFIFFSILFSLFWTQMKKTIYDVTDQSQSQQSHTHMI